MDFIRRFKVLIYAPNFNAEDLEGARLQQIIDSIKRFGFEVIRAHKVEDAELVIKTDAAIGCLLVDWGKRGLDGKPSTLINLMRKRGLEMPIVIIVRRQRLEDIPVEVLDFIDGYIFLAEETPEYIAKGIVSRVKQYAESLKTPFFGTLVDYTEKGNQLWTCPGHNGGIFYNRSPIGRIFVDYLGEAIFRNDIDNSVLDLGDLIVHEGPALKAQQEAATIFGAEKTYFVLNGTSASNKIVLSALVAHGDLVLFDRNNHKAAHHGALFLGGGIPVFLETNRNAYGLVGPIHWEALQETSIRQAIKLNPLVTDPKAWKRPRPFRVAIIEQCTYDGTIYNAEMILEKIGHLCDYILFDEAWAGFMKFHPLYVNHYAMGLKNLNADSPGIIATQSTHKQLAGFSQASQIHTKDSHLIAQRRRVEHRRFNESFLLHASTSPFYPLFASLDVGAQMMKGKSGFVLWDDTIRLGIELRKKIRAIKREFESQDQAPAKRWFFDPFVPFTVQDEQGKERRWEEMPTHQLATNASYWQLNPNDTWHGFPHVAEGYALIDPNKLTLLTPGFDRNTGHYTDFGIPAPVVSQFLRENRIVAEKHDLHSLLFLLTPGVEASKAGTLISGLVAFKQLHDSNTLISEVLPQFYNRHKSRYDGVCLADLCHEMHMFYKEHNASLLQKQQFQAKHFPEMVMTPHAAVQQLTKNNVDYLPVSELEGRIATTLLLTYPPGIGTVLPGERFNEAARPMIDYLLMFERAANRFPGFDTEIQGVYREIDQDKRVRFYTYVVKQ